MHLYLTDEEMIELDKKHYIEIGREENRNEMILNMYNKKIDLKTISDISNLSIKEIEKIIKKIK